MEKDDTVGESSPHIANIGRLVEVSLIFDRDREVQGNNTSIEPIFILLSGYGEQDSLHAE